MGRDHSLCVPGWNGIWWCSQRLECVWFCSPQAHKQEDVVEQEHVPARMQELCSQQAGDPQKPTGQGESPQMSMAKPCLGACLGQELCLASCKTMVGDAYGISQWWAGQPGAWRSCMSRDALQTAAGFPSRASSLTHSCGFGDPCAPGAAARSRA